MNKKYLKEMFNFTKNQKETIKVGIIILLYLVIYELSYPFIMKEVVDNSIPTGNIKLTIGLSFVLIILVIARYYLDKHSAKRRRNCWYDNNSEIKDKVFKGIQEASISELDKIQEGNLFEILQNQSWEASRLFIWNFIGLICVRLSLVVTILIVLLILNFKIGIAVLALFIISYLILIPFYFKTMKIYKKLQEIVIDMQGSINEYIESYSTTKTLKLEERNLIYIKGSLNKSKKQIINASRFISLHNALFSALTFGAVILVLLVGGKQLSIGAAAIMIIIDYIGDLNNHMQILLDHVHEINNRYNCFLNVLKLSKLPKEKDEGTKNIDHINTIEFKNVSLSYDGKNIILDNINLKVDKQIQIAIVGKSGVGKTSLVNLLPRFYELSKGSILINGIDYKEYKLNELRNNIAYVFQEPVIFEKTILENIKFGNSDDIADKDVINICRRIGLDSKIKQLPNGYNTLINSKTDLLSYGEKQLLSFARAILKNGDLVILDEVTSNLDLEFEQYIMNATKEMLQGKISFIIAHRLNTIKNSDLIIFFDKQIVEMGTHDELIEKQGYYYNLYMSKK